jgi:predicted PurR-regulated permease PerM
VLLVLALGISALFLWMIHEFLMALLFAGILSGLFQPLYQRILRRTRGRAGLASALTLLVVFLLFIIPLLGFLTLVAAQAVELGTQARPWVEEQVRRIPELGQTPIELPLIGSIALDREQIMGKVGEFASAAGGFMIGFMTAAARGTLSFFLLLFVMLYAMFFFLSDGRAALQKILYYLPLAPEDENRMLEKFLSVSRATLKGTLVIGVVQGALGGVAFWVAGIQGAALWAALMAVLSVIPGLGPAIIWVPAVLYLFVVGRWGAGLGLLAWCAAIVGTVDNLLRPWLVGKDTKLPDLLILLSTLGGIVLFGAAGIVVGPIVAALFVTVWDLYGAAFRDVLPGTEPALEPVPPAEKLRGP